MLVNKITTGFVIQTFDTKTRKWVRQEFVAGDECEYEDEYGEPIQGTKSYNRVEHEYLPFDMVQPTEGE